MFNILFRETKMITKKIFKITLISLFLPLSFLQGAEYRIGLSMHDVERRVEGLSLIHIPSPRDVEESRMPSSA